MAWSHDEIKKALQYLRNASSGGGGSNVTITEGGNSASVTVDGELSVIDTTGKLVPETYDTISLTYVTAGNGIGEIDTVSYFQGGVLGTLVATLTLSYDASNNLTLVTRS